MTSWPQARTHRLVMSPRSCPILYEWGWVAIPGFLFLLEHQTGVEPVSHAWEARVLPMYYWCLEPGRGVEPRPDLYERPALPLDYPGKLSLTLTAARTSSSPSSSPFTV